MYANVILILWIVEFFLKIPSEQKFYFFVALEIRA